MNPIMKKIAVCLLCVFASVAMQAQQLHSQQGHKKLYGFADNTGAFRIQPAYKSVLFDFTEGVAAVSLKGKGYMLIDTAANVLSPVYDWIGRPDACGVCMTAKGGKNTASGHTGGKLGLLSVKGVELLPTRYDAIGEFNDFGLAIIGKGGNTDSYGNVTGRLYGLVDVSGRVVLEPLYSHIGRFEPCGATWITKDGSNGTLDGAKFGFVDFTGKVLVEPSLTAIGGITPEGTCWVNKGGNIDGTGKIGLYGRGVKGGNFGFIDFVSGTYVEPTYTDIAEKFTQGIAYVKSDTKFGYVESSGRVVAEPQYDDVAAEFENNCAWVKQDGLCAVINRNGERLTPMIYTALLPLDGGFAATRKTRHGLRYTTGCGLVDSLGVEVLACTHDTIALLGEGRILVGDKSDDKVVRYMYCTTSGRQLTPQMFITATAFNDGVAAVSIDKSFAPQIRPEVNLSDEFRGGSFGKASAERAYFVIDTLGRARCKAVYSKILSYNFGRACCQRDGLCGWLDESGVEITAPIYAGVLRFNGDVAAARAQSGLWGFVNSSGMPVTEFCYQETEPKPVEGLMIVSRDKLWGAINRAGREVIPVEMHSREAVSGIATTLYVEGGRKPLSLRQVINYYIYKSDERNGFGIGDTIPEQLWDF